MKKFSFRILAGVSAFVLMFSFAACGKGHDNPKGSSGSEDPAVKEEGQYDPGDFRYSPVTEDKTLETEDISVWSSYPTDKIKRDEMYSADKTQGIEKYSPMFREVYIEGAKGETESGQLIFTTKKDIAEYTLSISDLEKGKDILSAEDNIEVFVQKYIELKNPTAYKQGRKASSPYGAGWYPDALVPYHSILEFGENNVSLSGHPQNQGFWFDVVIPEDAAPGLYKGTITLTIDGEDFNMPIKVNVFDFKLNKTMHAKAGFGIWRWMFSSAYDETYDADELYKAYYEYLLKYKVNGYWLPGTQPANPRPFTFKSDYGYVGAKDYAKIAYKYASREEVSCFEIPFEPGNTAALKGYLSEMAKSVINTEENRVEFNIFDKAMIYVYDEPTKLTMDKVVIKATEDIIRIKHELADEITRDYPDMQGIDGLADSLIGMEAFVTYFDKAYLKDYGGKSVESWCPVFNLYGNGDDNGSYFYDTYKAIERGESMWWYGCVTPQYPYINYHTDNSNVGSRVLNWQQKDYDITGNTYWSVNVFMQWLGSGQGPEATNDYVPRDCWTDPDSFPGDNNQVNGDGYLFYPGNRYNLGNDPVPSLRLPAIRDGQEDYEYLYQLEKLVEEANEELGASVTLEELISDLYDSLYHGVIPYDDGSLVLKARKEVAGMIEALSGQLKAMATVVRDGARNGRTRVSVYAPEHSSVKVNGVAAKYENGAYHASLKLDKREDNVVEIAVENGGKKTVLCRTAKCGGKVIDSLEDNGWTGDEMTADGVMALQGKGILFTAEHGDKKSMTSSLDIADGDFSDFESVELYAFNPDESVIRATFRLVDAGGNVQKKIAVIRPGRWTKVRIPLKEGVFKTGEIKKIEVCLDNPGEEDGWTSVLVDNIVGVYKKD